MFVQNTNNKPVSNSPKRKPGEKEKLQEASESKNLTFLEILESIVPSDGENTKELNELWKDLPDLEKALIANPNLPGAAMIIKTFVTSKL